MTENKRVTANYVRLGYEGRKRCRCKRPVCYGTVRCLLDLNPIEQAILLACPDYMTNGTEYPVEIKMVMGFEMFGRGIPYHNYESWSSGFQITGKGFTCSEEYLDTAVYAWAEAVIKASEDERRIENWRRFLIRPVGVKPSA